MRNKNVAVVGGAGYVGTPLVHLLMQRGFRVTVIDSLVYGVAIVGEPATRPDKRCETI